MRVRYIDSDGHERVGQTFACTLLWPGMAVESHVAMRFRPEAPQDILLEKDLGIYRTIAASAWTVTGILVLCIVPLVASLRRRDMHGELRALGN